MTATANAGFVLAGGRSSRMGRDKALLEFHGATLLEVAARKLRQVVPAVTIVGPPQRYGHLGWPVIPDLVDGCGPLGGLYTALSNTAAEWNLVLACDMPAVTPETLRALLQAAPNCGCDALVPETAAGWEPLCAVYHRRLAPALGSAIQRKLFKMQEFVSKIGACPWPAPDAALFANLNTPEEAART